MSSPASPLAAQTDNTSTPTPEESTAAVQPNPPQPTAPPKESIRQGFVRGMRGEQYAIDAQGNLVNMRTTEVSPRGTFGSILAGAVVGALAGARSARPGGIPSHELRGGVGAGATAANEAIQGRDIRAREQAAAGFTRKTEAQKAQDEHLNYMADIHMKGLQELNLAHNLDVAEREDPLHYEQLKNATELGQLQLESEVKNLGLINERTYSHYADVPKGDIDKFGRNQVKIMTMPDGSVKVWDRTFDARTTPNATDFEIKDLAALDPTTGKAEWRTVGTVKAGQGTAAQLEAEIDKERTQLMSFAKQNSDTAKSQAEAEASRAKAELDRETAKNMRNLGVTVPPGFKLPADVFTLDQDTLRQQITGQGGTVPANFPTLYAVGHYKGDMKDFITQQRVRGGSAMTKVQASDYIRTFINPNFDEKTYDDVKGLEKDFSSTKAGTAGGNLIAFNTATDHLGQLWDAAAALNAGNLRVANSILQRLGLETGKAAPQVYDIIRTGLTGELGKVYKGGVPDVAEAADIKAGLARNSSPQAIQGALKAASHLMLSKAGEVVGQYVGWTGELPPQTISPAAADVYRKLGISIQDVLPAGASVPLGKTGAGGAGKAQAPSARVTNAAQTVPPDVAKVLSGVAAGKHTLTDGSVWIKAADGTITPGPAATPQGQ